MTSTVPAPGSHPDPAVPSVPSLSLVPAPRLALVPAGRPPRPRRRSVLSAASPGRAARRPRAPGVGTPRLLRTARVSAAWSCSPGSFRDAPRAPRPPGQHHRLLDGAARHDRRERRARLDRARPLRRPTTLEWVANAYTLVFAACCSRPGLAADRLGARAVFLAGLGTFAAGSVAATLAPTAAALIAAQAVLGVGAALVLPTSLSLLSQVFEDPARRVRAVGVWAAGSAVSFATGPVLGGLLIEQAGWRSIFVINLPLAAVAAGLALTQVGGRAARRARSAAPLNLGPQVAAVAMLLALTFGLVQSGADGWGSGRVVFALGLAAVLAAALVVRERSTDRPVVPRALTRDPRFTRRDRRRRAAQLRLLRRAVLPVALPAAGPRPRRARDRARVPAAAAVLHRGRAARRPHARPRAAGCPSPSARGSRSPAR